MDSKLYLKETTMKKWFQVYVGVEGEEESMPMRMDPDMIQGFVKYTNYITLVYTPYGKFEVHEEYEKFSKRLFSFVNFDEFMKMNSQPEEVVTTTKKRYVVKIAAKKQQQEELEALQDYYDSHQPEDNSGRYH